MSVQRLEVLRPIAGPEALESEKIFSSRLDIVRRDSWLLAYQNEPSVHPRH